MNRTHMNKNKFTDLLNAVVEHCYNEALNEFPSSSAKNRFLESGKLPDTIFDLETMLSEVDSEASSTFYNAGFKDAFFIIMSALNSKHFY